MMMKKKNINKLKDKHQARFEGAIQGNIVAMLQESDKLEELRKTMLEWATANPSGMLPIVRHGWEAYYEAWRDRVTNSGIIGALLFGFVAGLLFEPLEPVHTEGMWPRKTFAAIYTVVVAVSVIQL